MDCCLPPPWRAVEPKRDWHGVHPPSVWERYHSGSQAEEPERSSL